MSWGPLRMDGGRGYGMVNNILIERQITPLHLYVAVLTSFEPRRGALICLQVVVLAENEAQAQVLIAMRHRQWEVQSLLCISDQVWFKAIILDGSCPPVQRLAEAFAIHGIREEVVKRIRDSWDGQ